MNWFDFSNYNRRSKILWGIISLGGAIALLFSVLQLGALASTQGWQFLCLLLVVGFVGRLAFEMPNPSGVMSPTDALIFSGLFSRHARRRDCRRDQWLRCRLAVEAR
jgi:hypothetical protein